MNRYDYFKSRETREVFIKGFLMTISSIARLQNQLSTGISHLITQLITFRN